MSANREIWECIKQDVGDKFFSESLRDMYVQDVKNHSRHFDLVMTLRLALVPTLPTSPKVWL